MQVNSRSGRNNQALKEYYAALEEAKADIAGLHSMKFFVAKGIVPKEMEKVHAVSALETWTKR